MTTYVDCPNCSGSGQISQFICYSVWDKKPIRFMVSCPYCLGAGKLKSGSKKAIKAASLAQK